MFQERLMHLDGDEDGIKRHDSSRNQDGLRQNRLNSNVSKAPNGTTTRSSSKQRLNGIASGKMSQKALSGVRVSPSQALEEDVHSTTSTPSMDDLSPRDGDVRRMGSRRHLDAGKRSKRKMRAMGSHTSLGYDDSSASRGEGSTNHSPTGEGNDDADDLYVPSSMRRHAGASKRRDTHTGAHHELHSERNRLQEFVVPPVHETNHAPKVQRDYDLLNQLIETLKEKEKQRKKRGYTKAQFIEVYERTKQLLEELWEEMHVPEDEREAFGRLAFNTKTTRNCVIIFDEISRLCRIRSVQHSVITKIEQREVFIKRLQRLDLRARNGTNPDILSEVASMILSLRTTSVELIEFIQQWRSTQKTPRVFSWNDGDYICKMFCDLNWLHLSSFSTHIPFSVENNPFLLPLHMRCELSRKRILGDMPQKGKGSMRSGTVNTPKSPTAFSPSSFLSPSAPQAVFGPISHRNRTTSEVTDKAMAVASEELKPAKPLSSIMKTLDQKSKEELERIQEAETAVEAEEDYMKRVEFHNKRTRAASKIQTVVRAMLARKQAHQRRKAKRVQERHRRRVLARMEEEQQQRKEENRLQKKNSISQLISQIDDDSLFNVPHEVAKKMINGEETDFELQTSFFDREESLWNEPSFKRNGKFKVKLNI